MVERLPHPWRGFPDYFMPLRNNERIGGLLEPGTASIGPRSTKTSALKAYSAEPQHLDIARALRPSKTQALAHDVEQQFVRLYIEILQAPI